MRFVVLAEKADEGTGIGRLSQAVVHELRKLGHVVDFVSNSFTTAHENNIELFWSFNLKNIVVNAWALLKILRQADHVLVFDVRPVGVHLLFASLLSGKKYHLHCVGTYSFFVNSRLKNLIFKFVVNRAIAIYALSSHVKEKLQENSQFWKRKNIKIVAPGIDSQNFYYRKERSLHAAVAPYIITVGAIKSRKGHDLSLKAYIKLLKNFPNLQYVIVGDLDNTLFCKKLLEEVQASGVGHSVKFIQDISDDELQQLYSHAEFYVMTSRSTQAYIEGFGLVYLEAALCGVPAIGALNSGASDAIVDGQTGLLVSTNIDDIHQAMKSLMSDQELRNKLAENARAHAKKFTWQRTVKGYCFDKA